MPVLRITSAVERYRYFARPDFNIHALAGHGEDGLPNIRFVSARILDALKPTAEDVVLDIGCGDGFLLSQAAKQGAKCIGIVPTKEEQQKLEAALPGVDFAVGLAQQLPLNSGSASRIVCNSVLVLLENEQNVRSALREIARVATPEACIWLGEIPSADELLEHHTYQGSSLAGLLLHELRFKGIRAFLSALRSIMRSSLGKQTLLLNSSPIFYASSEKFIRLAGDCGLRVLSWHKHTRIDYGTEKESSYRYNYLFVKDA